MSVINSPRKNADAINADAVGSMDVFRSRFDSDGASDATNAVDKSCWDFSTIFLAPTVQRHIRNPKSATTSEIGYVGGRLLNAACDFFGQVVGIDVHKQTDLVSEFLASLGNTNFRLASTDGKIIPEPSESLDFVCSFIVLQHLDSFATFTGDVSEIARTLK